MNPSYFGNSEADTILIQMVDDHDLSWMEQEVSHITSLVDDRGYLLVVFKVKDWNDDLSPWKAPAVFGKDDFGGHADKTLSDLIQWIHTYKEMHFNKSLRFYLGGYSLAGLFALWAGYQTGIFEGIAAVSPSVWFPGFCEYVHEYTILTSHVYLSLGDKEEKTRNPIMSKVGDSIRNIDRILNQQNISCTLEWNVGNHFKEPDLRTAKGFAWLLHQRIC